ncbi:MAG: DUF721 domain-containing protein [Gemmatimonadota bacterium]
MSRESDGPTRVGRALERYLERSGLAERVDQAAVVPEWEACVGERIAEATRPLRVSNGVLFVAVRSSAWMMELKLMEREILERLDADRERRRIREIRFVMDE